LFFRNCSPKAGEHLPRCDSGRSPLTYSQRNSFSDLNKHTLVTTVVHYNSPQDVQKVMDMCMKQGMAATLERLAELLLKLRV